MEFVMGEEVFEAIQVEDNSHNCVKCDLVFKNAFELQNHLISHTEYLIKCYICKINFLTSNSYQDHMSSKHKYNCCDNTFDSYKLYKEHCIKYHPQNIIASSTSRRDKTKLSININNNKKEPIYINIKETLDKPLKCPMCTNGYNNMKGLRFHWINTHVKSLICELCKEGFSSTVALNDHYIIVHTCNIYKCKRCNKTFSHILAYNLHYNGYCI